MKESIFVLVSVVPEFLFRRMTEGISYKNKYGSKGQCLTVAFKCKQVEYCNVSKFKLLWKLTVIDQSFVTFEY